MNYGLLLLGEHSPDRVVRLARLVEAHGFQDLWFADEKFYRDPYVSLAHVANHTTTIRLGTCVTDPFTRHPAVIAMGAATLDEVSAGRAVLGLGAGFSGLEAVGVRRGKTVRTLRQAIDAIRRLWAGETVSVDDEAFVLHDTHLDFAARHDIPILLASSSRQVLRLAGEAADEVMLGDLGSSAVLAPALAEVEKGATKAGRSIGGMKRIARLNLVLSEDLAAAREAVRPWILAYLWHAYPDWSRLLDYTADWEGRLQPLKDFIESQGGGPRNVGDREQVIQFGPLLPDSLVRRYALAGRSSDVVEQIGEIAACGVTQIALYPTPLPGQTVESVLQEFFERVLPNT
jgi:5,10-methylenetetrahydromethanopterin reductase